MSATKRASRYSAVLLVAAAVLIGAGAARANEQIHVGKAQGRQAALPGAEHLAAAAQAQILLGDAEPVLGLAQDRDALARDRAERRLVE